MKKSPLFSKGISFWLIFRKLYRKAMRSFKHFLFFFIMILPLSLSAQTTLPLYEGIAPHTLKLLEKDQVGEGGRVTQVAMPELIVYYPDQSNANQMAILICPGGGYGLLAIQHEGHDIAKWYSEQGYVAAVLKYRLPQEELVDNSWEVPLHDVKAGIEKLRENAVEWNIHPNRVGVLGFSAGGHLAASVSVHGEEGDGQLSSRPDFSILVYPVISMDPDITHQGSRKNLLGEKLDTEWEEFFSNEKQVNQNTPPAFLVHSWDDRAVPAENSIRYAKALNEADVRVELHLFEKGGHGYGMGNQENHGNAATWITLSDQWIQALFSQ